MSHSCLPFPVSLWSTIAPFDHHSHFLSRYLWPLLSDWDVMQAMMANSATMAHLPHLTVHHVFKLSDLLTQSPGSEWRYRPHITKVSDAEPGTLAAARCELKGKLAHVTSLSLSDRRRLGKTKSKLPLPPSLTSLHLTTPGRLWPVVSSASYLNILHVLTIDDSITNRPPAEWLSGPLPPHVHTLTIRTPAWDWPSFQRLHLTADNTQLRSLCIGRGSHLLAYLVDISLLPRSLTQLDLSDTAYLQPLSTLDLPNLVRLRLGVIYNPHQPGFNEPITVDSFAGLPILRELDLRDALFFNSALSVGALPATLICLSLPIHYKPRVIAGALPASLERLQIARACKDEQGAFGANQLEEGCLPAGLLAFIVKQREGPRSAVPPLPFMQPLTILPASLVELRIVNHAFNQTLDALTDLPHLSTLTIDSALFARPLDPVSNLTRLHTLELHIHFPSPLPTLPAQLRHLTVRPPSEVSHTSADYNSAQNELHRGYTHQLTLAQFAQCDRLETLSVDADMYEADLCIDSTTVYVFVDWVQQQRHCPLFDWPIAVDVLPASLQRLRLPQHYRYKTDKLVAPQQCRVWLGRQRVR